MKKILLLLTLVLISCTKDDTEEIEVITPEERIESVLDNGDSTISYLSHDLQTSSTSCKGLMFFLFRLDVNEIVFIMPNEKCEIESSATFNYEINKEEQLVITKKSNNEIFGILSGITKNSFVFNFNDNRYLFERDNKNDNSKMFKPYN